MIGVGRIGTKMVGGLLRAGHLSTVPVPVLTTTLYQRFSSRGESDFHAHAFPYLSRYTYLVGYISARRAPAIVTADYEIVYV